MNSNSDVNLTNKNNEKSMDNNFHREDEENSRMLNQESNRNKISADDDDLKCGIWIFQGPSLQRFANRKIYVIFFALIGFVTSGAFSYYATIITTLEKRYKIPSRNSGIISISGEISTLLVSLILGYYAGKGHRPKWMAFGLLTITIYCCLTVLPHFIYGAGSDALALTIEYGDYNNTTNISALNTSERKNSKYCSPDNEYSECEIYDGNYAPQIIFFGALFISGIGQTLVGTLGTTYLDDNIKKSETASFMSLQFFFRLLGPTMAYALGSLCLKYYISPTLTPTIDDSDPRWVGAWWIGWIVFAFSTLILSLLTGMFPKKLPNPELEKYEESKTKLVKAVENPQEKASFQDMIVTYKRMLSNPVLMFSNISALFYIFGCMPYFLFTPKYIENQFRQSASTSNMATGSVSLVFSAVGILLSGMVITKYKPRARPLAAWNVIITFITVTGVLLQTQLGCLENEQSIIIDMPMLSSNNSSSTMTCNTNCFCDHVEYSPVCGENGMTYVSACHAGCKVEIVENDKKTYRDCSCVNKASINISQFDDMTNMYTNITQEIFGGTADSGPCPVNCHNQFMIFLVLLCSMNFLGSTARSSNFIIYLRSVDERDKTVALAFGQILLGLFAFIPSPIVFGVILDKMCLVWGKSCSASNNCWLYDGEMLRLWMNLTAAILMGLSGFCDVIVWYYAKDMKIYDDDFLSDIELTDMNLKSARTSISH